MAKTLDEILRAGGKMDPDQIAKLQTQAKAAGMTKRVIHIELDLLTGNLKSQATPMDHVLHLGMLEFYKATVLGQMLGRAISKPDPEPAVEAVAPPVLERDPIAAADTTKPASDDVPPPAAA